MADRMLVTGGSGFIGSTLVDTLVGRGAEVHCLLLPDDPALNLGEVRDAVRIHRADLTDLDEVRDAVGVARPDVVLHLAAIGVTDVDVDLALAVRVNVEGTLNLLTALDGNFRVFVNTGTCHEYGTNEPPFSEDQDPRPELPYAITKTAVWHFCRRLYSTKRWPIVSVRPFTVYGPRQPDKAFIPSCIRAAQSGVALEMTMGEQQRDLVYVTDIVEGFIRAATSPEAVGGTFNLCTGQAAPLFDIARLIVEQMGNPIAIRRGALPYRTGEIWRLVGDNTRARTILGWEPRVPLHAGIQHTIQYFVEKHS